ncbi:MAG: SpoIIE family protein phosphatase [Bacteroidales bacterium]|nr:SpoIIE family protein phosphatase [Bacteroidales bacterium]
MGNAYKALRNYNLALSFYKKSNDLASEINYQEVMARNYKALSEIYSTTNNYKSAFEYQKLFAASRHTIRDEKIQIPERLKREQLAEDKLIIASLQRQIQRQKLLAELEAKQRLKEIEIKNLELENQQAKIKRMNTLIASAVILIIVVAGFLFMVYRQFLQKKKANIELTEKNRLISFQKKQITDSIRYASKIQKAVLPPKEIITEIVPQHFILNKPRDIVSGDYYWTTQRGEESIIAVADCTGHGVPGAFMSMLGIAFLNEIVNRSLKASSHEILDQLRAHVMKSLHQTGKEDESKDGMDIALCIIDMKKKELQFSGAHNPLFLIRNEELTEIKADKMPIGISLRYNQPFTCKKLRLLTDDMLYIFSDGYYDQFGGPNKKKFSMRRFKEILLEIHLKSMEEQQYLLEQYFLDWKGKYDQLDDILVMGIKV